MAGKWQNPWAKNKKRPRINASGLLHVLLALVASLRYQLFKIYRTPSWICSIGIIGFSFVGRKDKFTICAEHHHVWQCSNIYGCELFQGAGIENDNFSGGLFIGGFNFLVKDQVLINGIFERGDDILFLQKKRALKERTNIYFLMSDGLIFTCAKVMGSFCHYIAGLLINQYPCISNT